MPPFFGSNSIYRFQFSEGGGVPLQNILQFHVVVVVVVAVTVAAGVRSAEEHAE
jgi:hypothetical protein